MLSTQNHKYSGRWLELVLTNCPDNGPRGPFFLGSGSGRKTHLWLGQDAGFPETQLPPQEISCLQAAAGPRHWEHLEKQTIINFNLAILIATNHQS